MSSVEVKGRREDRDKENFGATKEETHFVDRLRGQFPRIYTL